MSIIDIVLPSYIKYIAITGLLVGVGGYGYINGMSHVQDKWNASISDSKVALVIVKQKQSEITERTVTKYIDRYKTITVKEPIYVQQASSLPDECMLSYNFGLLHNAAATNSSTPKTPDDFNGETTTVKAVDLAETIVVNYTTYNKVATQLESLQDWVTQQSEIKSNVN